jgi:hypothetical protein
MVEDSRKAIRTETVKPVNIPEPITVKEDAAGLPIAVKTSRRQSVAAITDRWRVDDEWWRREPVSRFYFIVILTSGQRLVIYKDLTVGNWYWHRHSSK